MNTFARIAFAYHKDDPDCKVSVDLAKNEDGAPDTATVTICDLMLVAHGAGREFLEALSASCEAALLPSERPWAPPDDSEFSRRVFADIEARQHAENKVTENEIEEERFEHESALADLEDRQQQERDDFYAEGPEAM